MENMYNKPLPPKSEKPSEEIIENKQEEHVVADATNDESFELSEAYKKLKDLAFENIPDQSIEDKIKDIESAINNLK